MSIQFMYISVIVHGSTYSNCTDGQVRLFGGTTEYEGTVEVCNNNAWGTFSGYATYYGSYTAQTICNTLGYTAPGKHEHNQLTISENICRCTIFEQCPLW